MTAKKTVKAAVNKSERISDVIKSHPEAIPIMMKHGIHCVGCHAAMFETIEQGSQAHGMQEKEINLMVEEINKTVGKKK